MKKIFILVLMCLAFAFSVQANTRVSSTVEGSEIVVFEFSTDGTWQAVTVPAAMKNTRHVFLQVHDGTENSYSHSDVEFIVSSSSDGSTGFIWTTGITISVGKDRSKTICYIRAATGQTFSVMVLR
jgi:hypothetical protein